jgi:hypothetical protein
VILTGNIAPAIDGIFLFNNSMIIAQPGESVNLKVVINDLQTYNNDIDFISAPISVEIKMRLCVKGEEFTSDKRCSWCQRGTYLYDPPK